MGTRYLSHEVCSLLQRDRDSGTIYLAMQNQAAGVTQAASQAESTSTGGSIWYDQYAVEHPEVQEETQPHSISVATDQSIRVTIPASSVATDKSSPQDSDSDTEPLSEGVTHQMGIQSENVNCVNINSSGVQSHVTAITHQVPLTITLSTPPPAKNTENLIKMEEKTNARSNSLPSSLAAKGKLRDVKVQEEEAMEIGAEDVEAEGVISKELEDSLLQGSPPGSAATQVEPEDDPKGVVLNTPANNDL